MHRIAVLAAAGLLGGWSSLAAQSSAPSAPAASSFADVVVVTATLEPETVEEVSATVDVIGRAEIERRAATTVLDLLRTVPGLSVAQSGSPGKVASLFTRGASSAQTLVLYDGVPLNDPVLGAFDWSAPSVEGIERIEVVRGPYSALWGSSAMGGVVHLVGRAAGPAPAGDLHAEVGSHDAARGGAALTSPLGPLALDAAGSLWTGEGELANDFFDGGELRARVSGRLAEGVRLGLLVRATEARIGLPFDFAGAPSPEREQESSSRLVALPLDVVAGAWQLDARASFYETDLELADPHDPFAASATETERLGVRAVARRALGDDAWLAGGVEHGRESAKSSSAFGPGLDGDRRETDAAFAQGSWAHGPVRFDLGVRHDATDGFGDATSAKAGAVVALGDGARLRASWGQSFRAPSLGDLYFPFFGNPELESERGESWELALEAERGALTGTVTGFVNDYDDLIQFDLARGLPFNIGRARARGVEARLAGVRGRLRAGAGASWLDAEDRVTGAPLPRRPELAGHLHLAWSAAHWQAVATWRHVGEREDVGAVELDPYSVLDLALQVPLGDRWQPYLRIDNALDRDYQEVVGFPAPGRAFALGVRVDLAR